VSTQSTPGRYPRSTPHEYPEYPMSHVCTGTRRQVLGDGGAVEADAAVHGAHGAPASDEVGRELGDAVRSVVSARARLGRRADQRRSVEVVRSAGRCCAALQCMLAACGAVWFARCMRRVARRASCRARRRWRRCPEGILRRLGHCSGALLREPPRNAVCMTCAARCALCTPQRARRRMQRDVVGEP
jgi:hypothetical protein